MSAQRHTLIGLFFVVVTGVLGWFTLFQSDLSLFTKSFPMTAYFQEGGGLREGDTVLVAGMRWGTVVKMMYEPDATEMNRRVKVDFTLEHEVALYNDQKIVIEDATVLGGKRLSIEPGSNDAGPWNGTLLGEVRPNVMEAVGKLVNDNSDDLKSVIESLKDVSAKVSTDLEKGEGVLSMLLDDTELSEGVSRAVAEIADTFANLKELTDRVERGEGTLGRLMADEEMYGTIQGIVAKLDVLFGDLEDHKGILGHLLDEEDQMLIDAQQVFAKVNEIVTKAEAGTGVVGMLLNDDEVKDSVAGIVNGLQNGEGTLGKLLKEDEVINKINTIADDMILVSNNLADAEGTVGKLINDPEIYNLLLKAVRSFSGALEEAREAAPISTFLNTVFLGF